jgi:hypothetical protein
MNLPNVLNLGVWDSAASIHQPHILASARVVPARAMRCAECENCTHFPSAKPIVRPSTKPSKRKAVGDWLRSISRF